jgi:hypothetical protein
VSDRSRFRFGGPAVVALTAWIGVSLLSALQSSLRSSSRGVSDLLAGTLLAWLPWLVLSVPVVYLSRLAWTEGRRTSLVLTHVAAAGGCLTLYLVYLTAFRVLPQPATPGVWSQELQNVAGEHLIGSLLVYIAIATAGRLSMKSRQRVERASEPFRGVPVRRRGRKRWVAPAEINWVGAEGSYVRLHLAETTELLRSPLGRLAEELEPWGFVRVHRSALVNLERVREVESAGHGDGTLVLTDGARVRLSRTYRPAFERAMKLR